MPEPDDFDRRALGLELWLLIIAAIGGGVFAMIWTIVKSIKW